MLALGSKISLILKSNFRIYGTGTALFSRPSNLEHQVQVLFPKNIILGNIYETISAEPAFNACHCGQQINDKSLASDFFIGYKSNTFERQIDHVQLVTIKRNQSILVALSLFHQDVSSVPVV
jgi:hypothetical protein